LQLPEKETEPMTNYCTNLIEVQGSAADIATFRTACLHRSGGLDFNAILPMPEVLNGTHMGTGTRMGWDAELGAAALRGAQVEFPFHERLAILERESIRKAGIRTFEQLENWLKMHRPNALELGARCLEAHRQTGYLLERDWKVRHWGTHHWEGFAIREETDTRLVAEFATAWSPATGVYHEIARRFPSLAITVSAIEEGNEYSYRLSARDGQIIEDEPGLTVEFMEHVEGRPREVHPIYIELAQLDVEPAMHARHWLAKARIGRALRRYPVYRPPHDGIEMLMPEPEASANFDYFIAQRANRIDALRVLLASFDVPVEFSEAAKSALDAWLGRYGAFLYVREKGSSYLSRLPAWDGARLGLNVIHDLAVFLGDFAIHESPNLRWEMHIDVPTGLRNDIDNFQKPVVAGFPGNPSWRFDPLADVHRICHALRETTYFWRKPMFSMGPRSLYTRFVSKTLLRTLLLANGDFAGANRVMLDQ
jgi:Ferredoxin-like domain in Api92-like protein